MVGLKEKTLVFDNHIIIMRPASVFDSLPASCTNRDKDEDDRQHDYLLGTEEAIKRWLGGWLIGLLSFTEHEGPMFYVDFEERQRGT